MSSRRSIERALALLIAAALGGEAAAERIVRAVKPRAGEGIAVFGLELPYAYTALHFKDGQGRALRIDDLVAGRDLVFVLAPAGRWRLDHIEPLKGQSAPVREPSGPVGFEVVDGAIAYGGDIELRAAQPNAKAYLSGLNWDEFGEVVASRKMPPELLERLPWRFVDRAAGELARLGLQGEAQPRYPALIAAHRTGAGARAERALQRAAERYKVPLPTPGMEREALGKSFKEVPPSDARFFCDGPEWCWITFDGMWGVEGRGLIVAIRLHKDKVSTVRLRELAPLGLSGMPSDEVLTDLEGWLDAR